MLASKWFCGRVPGTNAEINIPVWMQSGMHVDSRADRSHEATSLCLFQDECINYWLATTLDNQSTRHQWRDQLYHQYKMVQKLTHIANSCGSNICCKCSNPNCVVRDWANKVEYQECAYTATNETELATCLDTFQGKKSRAQDINAN